MKILLKTERAETVQSLTIFFRAQGWPVDIAEDEMDCLLYIKDTAIDVAVLDCGVAEALPKVLSDLKVRPPILAFGREASFASLLNSGADDAMSLPVNFDELLARCAALYRRANGLVGAVIDLAPNIRLDLGAQALLVNGKAVALTAKEYLMMEAMAVRKGKVTSKNTFLNVLYGGLVDEPTSKILDVFMCKIRHKLRARDVDVAALIQTSWGRGWMIP